MEQKYNELFTPLQVKETYIRNRIWTAPTLIPLLTPDKYPNDAFIAYYREKARGGAGVVTIGETAVDWEYGKTHSEQVNIWGNSGAIALANVVDAIHQYGAKASIELCHGGVFAAPELIGGKNPIGPSALVRQDGVQVEEMTEKQMDDIANHFAEACQIAERCGFDEVMIHGAHGWLLGAFLSTLDNHRTDEYGGCLENRAKFPLMVLDRIHQAVSDRLLIGYRLSVDEGEGGGISIADSLKFLELAGDRIDIIHQSFGTRHTVHTRGVSQPSCFLKYGCNLYLARAVKEAGFPQPVIAVGSLDNAQVANKAIADGWCDGVAIARGIIADPQFPNKVKADREDEIVPCIKCFKCLDISVGRHNTDKVLRFSQTSTHRFVCSVNSQLGRQHYPKPDPIERVKKVAVVGGGPAGLRAALDLARRGHNVVLYEKADQLGGKINFAQRVDFKEHIKLFRDYLVNAVEKERRITVRLQTEAVPELVEKEGFDAVVVAIGGKPKKSEISGSELANVKRAEEVYGYPERSGKKVVIIGGGQTGTEVALNLLNEGKDVTIIASRDAIAHDAGFTYRIPLVERVEGRAEILLASRVVEIQEEGVLVRSKANGEKRFLKADTVVLANGFETQRGEADAFRKCAPEHFIIGDAMEVHDILYANRTGADVAVQI